MMCKWGLGVRSSSLILVVALALVRPPAAAAQDADPVESLNVAVNSHGNITDVSGTIDLPEGAVLTLSLEPEPERVMHSKVECRITPMHYPTSNGRKAEIRKKKFSCALEAAPGFYRLQVRYLSTAQIEEQVLRTLGVDYSDWTRTFVVASINTSTIVTALRDERPRVEDLIAQVAALAGQVASFVKNNGDDRAFKALDKQIDASEKKIREHEKNTVYPCTMNLLADTLEKMRGCSPSAPKMHWAPGSPEAEHLASGFTDIPEGVNDEWQLELVRAFVARARHAFDRERYLPPLRAAILRWERALEAIRNPKASPEEMNEAKASWDQAAEAVRANAQAIEADLKDRNSKDKTDESAAEWCRVSREAVQQLEDFLVKRREARDKYEGGTSTLDEIGVRDARKTFDALNTAIRRFPGK